MSLLGDSHRRIALNWPRLIVIVLNVALWLLAARYLMWVLSGTHA